MSVGHFDYNQHKIEDIATGVKLLIDTNNSEVKDDWGHPRHYSFSEETISKFKEALEILEKATIMTQRIDWLVSGDDGEESFHRRWDEELNELNNE